MVAAEQLVTDEVTTALDLAPTHVTTITARALAGLRDRLEETHR